MGSALREFILRENRASHNDLTPGTMPCYQGSTAILMAALGLGLLFLPVLIYMPSTVNKGRIISYPKENCFQINSFTLLCAALIYKVSPKERKTSSPRNMALKFRLILSSDIMVWVVVGKIRGSS